MRPQRHGWVLKPPISRRKEELARSSRRDRGELQNSFGRHFLEATNTAIAILSLPSSLWLHGAAWPQHQIPDSPAAHNPAAGVILRRYPPPEQDSLLSVKAEDVVFRHLRADLFHHFRRQSGYQFDHP